MNNDPYETFGVPRDATPDEIRKVSRELAKRHHPDMGGDTERYRAVTEAAEVLSDPDRRARFDATGDTSDPRRESPNAELMNVLVPAMAQAFQELIRQGEKADSANLVAYMKRVLEAERAERRQVLRELEKTRVTVALSATRFKEPEGEVPLLAAAARHHLEMLDAQTKSIAQEEARIGRALAYLAKCGYEFTARNFGGAGMFTTTNSFWGKI